MIFIISTTNNNNKMAMLLYSFLSIILMPSIEGLQAYNESDVSYYVYTKQLKNTYLSYNEKSIEFDHNAIIVFIIHGWTESHTKQWYANLTNAYLSRTDAIYNVVQVDYRKPAAQSYPLAVASVKNIGDYIANYIVELIHKSNIPLENIQIVGHSLGGQVAGCLGASIQKLLGQKLTRITGLDPAGPLFNLKSVEERLDPTDADVVLVIHTDGFVFGTPQTSGTVDVFPNGGKGIQPGCPGPIVDAYCSHHRSYEYFIEAVKYGGMISTKCTDYVSYCNGVCKNEQTIDIGGTITEEDRGTYYLTTNSKPPYAKSS